MGKTTKQQFWIFTVNYQKWKSKKKQKMKDEYEKIKKQSCISNVFSYCIYSFEIPLIDLLIDEITQLGIITV